MELSAESKEDNWDENVVAQETTQWADRQSQD